MQNYNQFNQGNIMPLLMNFTAPTPIQDGGLRMPSLGYDDQTQIPFEMRMVCTRSAKWRNWTRKGGGDYKNENDDTKVVR